MYDIHYGSDFLPKATRQVEQDNFVEGGSIKEVEMVKNLLIDKNWIQVLPSIMDITN